MDLKEDTDLPAQLALSLAAGGTNLPLSWPQTTPIPAAPQAHTSMHTVTSDSPQHLTAPPPAHAHYNVKPPDTFVDKTLLEAAATFLENKAMSLPTKVSEPNQVNTVTNDNQSSIPWAIQQQLLQQYGSLMLEKMITNKQGEGGATTTATATTDTESFPQSLVVNSTGGVTQTTVKQENTGEPNSIEAQRDVYRRMLNYSMGSTLAQQYYLSQCGYNYMQDRGLFSRPDTTQGTSTTTSSMGSLTAACSTDIGAQLPSIDSVLLNLSTKKTNGKPAIPATSATVGLEHASTTSMQHHPVPAYGLQALANAAIEADPKAFSEADHHDHHRKDGIVGGGKSELEDVTDTDSSNMSPSDSSTSQIMSPPRNSYSHLIDNSAHISIPAAHTHQMSSLYQTGKSGSTSSMAPLPSIQHFSAISTPANVKHHDQQTQQHHHHSQHHHSQQQHQAQHQNPHQTASHQHHHQQQHTGGVHLPLAPPIKPSDLAAAAMKLKVETSAEKEIADRTIQEQIAAHHHQFNAAQQVQEFTALAAGNIDTAALLAKLQESNLNSDLHRFYEHDALSQLQQEPMELTSDLSPGKIASRRKSRGRPTSIESLRDPLGRQSSTTSSIGANTSVSGDGDDRTYDCEICGKQFSHNDRLRRHRKIHTTDKPYKCDICGKGFKEKCNLKHHRFIHTGEKPYKCETCGKSFNQRSSLKTHQKVHTGEKPFKCELCEKPFAQKYLLRQHMKKHIELNSMSSTATPAQQP